MAQYVEAVQAEGIFGRLDFVLELGPNINIIHAENGAGKTTLLHILANALNGDFVRFAHLKFRYIKITLSNQRTIELRRKATPDGPTLNVRVDRKQVWDSVPVRKILGLSRAYRDSYVQLSLFDTEQLHSANPDVKFLDAQPILAASYFPAFRTMIEAWANALEVEEVDRRRRNFERLREIEMELRQQGLSRAEAQFHATASFQARRAFGEFVPLINYPSPIQIARVLNEEVQRAFLDIGNIDRELLSRTFVEVFNSLSEAVPSGSRNVSPKEDATSILRDIQEILSEDEEKWSTQIDQSIRVAQSGVYDALRHAVTSIRLGTDASKVAAPILDVYRKALSERSKAQETVLQRITLYLTSINDFLQEKDLVILPDERSKVPSIGIRFNDNTTMSGLRALSSGERQLVTLIYAASRMSSQEVVLIDEPEISLHIDWQRQLLARMAEQLGERQIIVCTHSPSIGANYLENMIELASDYSAIDTPDDDLITDDLDIDIPF